MLSRLNMKKDVCDLYYYREEVHKNLVGFLENKEKYKYVKLALGISDCHGNYSASQHEYNLGPKILDNNSIDNVFNLAEKLYFCNESNNISKIIKRHNLPFLKISIGSEMAMMLKPNDFWVVNVRSTWAHLLLKNNFNYNIANEELKLYRDQDRGSEMDYRIWEDIYPSIGESLQKLGEMGKLEADRQGVKSGQFRYLWGDTIANALYEMYARKVRGR